MPQIRAFDLASAARQCYCPPMFRAVFALAGAILLGVFIYVALAVPLGSKTLWEHATAIGDSKEGQALREGVAAKWDELTAEQADGKKSSTKAADASQEDKLTDEERQKLRELIREKMAQR